MVRIAIFAILAAVVVSLGPMASSVALASSPCRIIDARHGQGVPDVYAVCGSTSVRLGPAESYGSSLNAASGKMLVVRQNGPRTDVVLVSQDASGAPLIEDVSRDVAQAALATGLPRGTRPTLDLTRFATAGALVVGSSGPATAAATKTVTVDFSARLHAGS